MQRGIVKKIILAVFITSFLSAYDQPFLYLGFNNILTGMPGLGGWHFEQGLFAFNTHTFLDNDGKLLACEKSPHFEYVGAYSTLGFQAREKTFLKGHPGFYVLLPYVFSSKVECNNLNFSSSGAGLADLYIGTYLQWDPIQRNNKPLFAHRLTLNVNFPSGKYTNATSFHPGNGVFYINPSWASTLFLTERWALSSNLYYVWSSENKHNDTQPGQAIFLNYSTEYQIRKHTYIALNGYFLQQFTDGKVHGVSVPHTRERVFSVGPGALYAPHERLSMFAYLYFEQFAKNRPQGINFIARLVLSF